MCWPETLHSRRKMMETRGMLKNEWRREKEQWRRSREIFIRTMPFLRGLGARAWHRIVIVERRGPVTDIPLSPDPSYDPPSTGSHGDIAIVHATTTRRSRAAGTRGLIALNFRLNEEATREHVMNKISFPISKRIKYFPRKYTIIFQLTMSM